MLWSDPFRVRLSLSLTALSLLASLLACQLGPQPPEPVPFPEQQTELLDETWSSVLKLAADTGGIMLVLTEQQLSSYLASRLPRAEQSLLNQPQVYLREGEIRIYGTADVGPFEAGTLLSVQPILDSEGMIAFEVTSAEFGPFPAPEALMQSLSDLLTEAFTGKLGSLATGIRISSLAISGGQVAIVGTLR